MSNWKIVQKQLNHNVAHYKIDNKGILNKNDWIENIKQSDEFILFFNEILSRSTFPAYFFETKAVSTKTLLDDFEFVLVKSISLTNLVTDPLPFQSYLSSKHSVVNFPNRGKDAHLVVPTEVSDRKDYTHLANFVRNAPEHQILDFWRTVAIEYEKSVNEKPIWLSTAGMGVSWLHMRIDSQPKYYRHQNFKKIN